jgi:hypothetical protein
MIRVFFENPATVILCGFVLVVTPSMSYFELTPVEYSDFTRLNPLVLHRIVNLPETGKSKSIPALKERLKGVTYLSSERRSNKSDLSSLEEMEESSNNYLNRLVTSTR